MNDTVAQKTSVAQESVSGGASSRRTLKILYVASLSPNDSSQYRLWALERFGHQVIPLNTYEYSRTDTVLNKLAFWFAVGPALGRLNRDLLQMVERERPDLVWTDKMLGMMPTTLQKLRKMGVATVSYMIDNPFGSRKDPGWRLYMKDIPCYDLHVVQRDSNIVDYRQRGARDVIKIQTAYEPTIHFPPPEGWSDANRDREVSFIGTPYDKRAEFLSALWKTFGSAIAVSGGLIWKKHLTADVAKSIYRGSGELFREDYREGIWKSKINLSFLTHANHDEFAHKSFEIAACEGFLLAERSDGHLQRFAEDKEAVYFSTLEECIEKIRRYLPDETERSKIGRAGRIRAECSGYDNDRQVAAIIDRIQPMVFQNALGERIDQRS